MGESDSHMAAFFFYRAKVQKSDFESMKLLENGLIELVIEF